MHDDQCENNKLYMYIESAVSQHHRLFSTLNSAGSLLGRLNFFPCVRRVRGVRPVAYLLLLLLLNLLVRKRPRAFRCNIFPFLRDLLCDGCVCKSLCPSVCVCVCVHIVFALLTSWMHCRRTDFISLQFAFIGFIKL